jgi:heme-degrading monooxygenase HmoA
VNGLSRKEQMTVYARLMTTEAAPGLGLDEDETVALWQDHLTGIFKDASGFQGAYVLGNAGDRKGLTITLWDSEEDADNSGTFEQTLAHIRDSLALPPTIDGYDVIIQI